MDLDMSGLPADWKPPPEAGVSLIAVLEAERALADDLHAAYTRLFATLVDLPSNLSNDYWQTDARYREARGL